MLEFLWFTWWTGAAFNAVIYVLSLMILGNNEQLAEFINKNSPLMSRYTGTTFQWRMAYSIFLWPIALVTDLVRMSRIKRGTNG
jgi:hypothetical protein